MQGLFAQFEADAVIIPGKMRNDALALVLFLTGLRGFFLKTDNAVGQRKRSVGAKVREVSRGNTGPVVIIRI